MLEQRSQLETEAWLARVAGKVSVASRGVLTATSIIIVVATRVLITHGIFHVHGTVISSKQLRMPSSGCYSPVVQSH